MLVDDIIIIEGEPKDNRSKPGMIFFFLYLGLMIILIFQLDDIISRCMFYSTLPADEIVLGDRNILHKKAIFHAVVSLVKIVIFIYISIMYRLGKLVNKEVLLRITFILFIIFMCFELPIWRCYNGSYETLWQLGGHLH